MVARAGVVSFSTSQIYSRNSLDPFDIVGFPLSPTGTEDVLALTISPDDIVIPFNPGVYVCETVVDTVIGGAGQPTAPICGNGFMEPQLGEECDDGNLADGDGCDQFCKSENQPPMAMCKDVTASADSSCQANASIDNGSLDPDGTIESSIQSPVGPYVLGPTAVTLTVTDDFGASDSCSATVTVEDNTQPAITAPGNITQECSSPNGNGVSLGAPTNVVDNCDATPEVANDAPALFPLGLTTVNWTATDDASNIGSDTQDVTIVDTTPPELSVVLSPTELWPPNHKMHEIIATVSTSDTCDTSPVIELVNITMNEGDEALAYDPLYDAMQGDGQTTNDIQYYSGTGQVFVRAERSGTGNGRVYTLTYQATDASGNTTQAEATVTVPHSQ